MRDSNYKSVSANKAALSITTTLYDRRALDCTADRPLVNSLNHLTFLASSSAKVRETLASDGGIERLIDILHECRKPLMNNDNLLVAWKWTLAFQCLVLIGTRGTEKIRQKVVEAGMIPIIATVLDNYLVTHRPHEHQPSNNTSRTVTRNGSATSSSPSQDSSSSEISALASARRAANSATNSNPETANSIDTPLPTAPNTANIHFNLININQGRDLTNLDPIANPHTIINPVTAQRENIDTNVTNNVNRVINSSETNANENGNNADNGVIYEENTSVENTRANTPDRGTELGVIFNNALNMTPDGHNSRNSSSLNTPSNQYIYESEFLMEEDISNMPTDALYRLLRQPTSSNTTAEIRRRYITSFFLRRLSEAEEHETNSYGTLLQPFQSIYRSRGPQNDSSDFSSGQAAPRNFLKGVLLPREDDIVWSLQLLAFISKYSYLKGHLQDTYLVGGMSLKSPPMDCCTTNNQVPGLDKDDDLDIDPENENDSDNASDVVNCNVILDDDNDSEVNEPVPYDNSKSDSPELLEASSSNTLLNNNLTTNGTLNNGSTNNDRMSFNGMKTNNLCPSSDDFENKSLFRAIKKAESLSNKYERTMEFVKISHKINQQIVDDQNKIKYNKIQSRLKEKESLNKKWCYDTYSNFEITMNDEDIDQSLQPVERTNIFPLVEKFTSKVQNNSDMHYWAGVIMRNSCRKDESRGGVRQCAHFDCGKWESYPREFAKCRRCKRTKYCSRDCQMKAWHYHRHWCIQSSGSTNTTNHNPHSRSGNTNTSTTDNDTHNIDIGNNIRNVLTENPPNNNEDNGDIINNRQFASFVINEQFNSPTNNTDET